MIKKIISISMLALASIAAHAEIDPVEKLKQAFIAEKNANSFAGFGGSCLNIMLQTKFGPQVSLANRDCFSYFVSRAFVDGFAKDNGLVFVYRNKYMDLVLIPNGTLNSAPKGNFYYLVNYDDAGNASEISIINDALP